MWLATQVGTELGRWVPPPFTLLEQGKANLKAVGLYKPAPLLTLTCCVCRDLPGPWLSAHFCTVGAVVGAQCVNCFITQQQGGSEVTVRVWGFQPGTLSPCGVSPMRTRNHSWEERRLQVPALARDLGQSLILLVLHPSVTQGCNISTSKGVYFEKQGQWWM